VAAEVERKFDAVTADALASLDPVAVLGGRVSAEPEDRLLDGAAVLVRRTLRRREDPGRAT
jgi:hypothetical protein